MLARVWIRKLSRARKQIRITTNKVAMIRNLRALFGGLARSEFGCFDDGWLFIRGVEVKSAFHQIDQTRTERRQMRPSSRAHQFDDLPNEVAAPNIHIRKALDGKSWWESRESEELTTLLSPLGPKN